MMGNVSVYLKATHNLFTQQKAVALQSLPRGDVAGIYFIDGKAERERGSQPSILRNFPWLTYLDYIDPEEICECEVLKDLNSLECIHIPGRGLQYLSSESHKILKRLGWRNAGHESRRIPDLPMVQSAWIEDHEHSVADMIQRRDHWESLVLYRSNMKSLQALSSCRTIDTLHLNKLRGFSRTHGFGGVGSLDLSKTKALKLCVLGGDPQTFLSEMTSLEVLDISHLRSLNSLDFLRKMPKLRELRLFAVGHLPSLRILLEMPTLEVIQINDARSIGDADFDFLGDLSPRYRSFVYPPKGRRVSPAYWRDLPLSPDWVRASGDSGLSYSQLREVLAGTRECPAYFNRLALEDFPKALSLHFGK